MNATREQRKFNLRAFPLQLRSVAIEINLNSKIPNITYPIGNIASLASEELNNYLPGWPANKRQHWFNIQYNNKRNPDQSKLQLSLSEVFG